MRLCRLQRRCHRRFNDLIHSFSFTQGVKRILQSIESTKTVLRESEQRLGPNHGITQDALNTLATAAIRVGDFDTARSSARRIRDAIGPDAAERQRIDEFVNARIAMYSGGAAAAEGPLRKLYLGTPATAAGRSFTALTLAEAVPHLESGGSTGGLVFFGNHSSDGVLYEFFDPELNLVGSVTIAELVADWEAKA